MDDRNQRKVALKVLLPSFRKDRAHAYYLKHEYEVGKSLKHPNVMEILDYGNDQGVQYVAMEFFPWPNMKDFIMQVLKDIGYGERLVRVMMPKIIQGAAEGLAYFNAQGWVHRDIKPDNFLVDEGFLSGAKGEVRLIDFALAVRSAGGFARALSKIFNRSKTTSVVQGTRSYMSPEQIRGQPLDERSDVYSFACTIYHVLTGFPPFTGYSSNELLNKHLSEAPPSIQSANRHVTPEFNELLQRSLAKFPKRRPQTMKDFAREIAGTPMFKDSPRAAQTSERRSAV